MKSFKKVIATALALTLLFSLGACGNSQVTKTPEPTTGTSATPSPSGETPAEKEITLSIALNQTWNKPNFEPMLKKYSELNPNIKFDIQIIPDGQFDELLNAKIRTGEAPDLVHYGMTQLFQKYDVTNSLVPLDDQPWVANLVNPSAVTIDGKIYAAPSNSVGGTSGVVYNKQIFEKYGIEIPKTYNDFLAVCEKLKNEGVTPILLQGKDAWTIGMWICTMFPNVIEDRSPQIYDQLNIQEVKYEDLPEFARCLDIMKELVDKEYINKDYLSTTVDMGITMMLEDKAAMCVTGSFLNSDLYAKDPSKEFLMFPFPVIDNARLTAGTVRVIAIFKDSKHIEESKKFLTFMQEAEQQIATNSDWGTMPATKGVEMELPPWVADVQANYISKGLIPLDQMGMRQYVGVGEMVALTQEVLLGNMTSMEALKEWDIYYEKLAREKKFPGWENK